MSLRTLFGAVFLPLFLGLTSAQCQDNECAICSVVADYLINFDTAEAVQLSTCTYSLISSAPIPNLQVLAVLKPRRNLNVKFVDKIKVIYGEATVTLSGGQALTSTSSDDIGAQLSSGNVEVVSGLTVSRNDDFTTIDVQQGDHALKLRYNGVSAHLRVSGPKGQDLAVDGVCKPSAALADHQSECEIEYGDPQNPPFDAQKETLCSKWDQLSTTVLVSRMKPVCQSVLKFTGNKDQLPCALLLAYDTHMLLQDQNTALVEHSCSRDVLKSCVTRVCGSAEFCGEKEAGSMESACFCHTSVAASYSATGKVGELECVVTDTKLSIPDCYLREKGIDHTQLQLKDATCKGELQPDTQLVVFQTSKDQMCGAMLKTVDGSMKYKNEVLLASSGAVVADMTCPFAIPVISVDFDVSVTVLEDPDSTGPIEYTSSALGTYTVELKAFLDAAHKQPIDGSLKLRLNTAVYFLIQVAGLDHLNPALVLDSCWATNQHEADKEPKYFLIKDRCPSDPSVALVRSGVGSDAELQFRIFQFTGKSSDIYLHCIMQMCLPQEGACEPECGGSSRRRRSSTPHYATSFRVDALTWK